jgi:hydrogenase nickel incorporation protein HypA/HybF
MHEVALMQDALRIALDRAREEKAARILTLRMRVGALSGVVPDALSFAFECLSRGTLAEGGTLEIENVPAVCWCASCRKEFAAPELGFECPACGAPAAEIRSGRELEVASLDLE